ncbi:substrate-binding domain-containing protein [Paraburkholderia youngii]|uniref:D-xylose transport system substrate-binding protein n=1 Tax=Paraburkholderia youngii TaxID=2782701 RepID=A0A7W8P0V0_9BURK|nr:substrate-binding domain-containing protein [Paraburkholderia youngii]MBB5399421.1 D-xylose transport system substrate-binding protein [Paraburkholderia youngii]
MALHTSSLGRRAVAAISLCTAAFAGTASAADSSVLIGVVFPTQNQARWATEEKIFVARAQANGDKVIFQYSNESAATQKNQVESMIQRGVKVLVLVAIDPVAAADLVKEAQAKGIKVIGYDRFVVGAKPSYNVGRDFYETGNLQASTAKQLFPSGDFALIRGDKATLAQVEMSKAYNDVLVNKPGINVVYDTLTPGWETATAQREVEAALQKNPNVKAVVVMWDNGGQAAVQALKSAGKKPGEVYVSGSDASTPSLRYIAQGWQTQSVWAPIDKTALKAADVAHALGTRVAPPAPTTTVNGVPTFYVPQVNVTKANLCEFITKIAPAGWVTAKDVFGPEGKSCE